MKTFLLSLLLALAAQPLWSQAYEKSMLNAIQKMEGADKSEILLECAMQFERISQAEPKQWLPLYYNSYSLIQLSFDESNAEKRDQLLDRAQENLDQAMALHPGESELHVLQAFLYPSRIMVDPMGRGMQYLDQIFSSLEKARQLDPDNPRIYFLEGVHKLNLPPSMGGGAETAKPILEKAAEKFAACQAPSEIWPNWGEETNRSELEKLR